MQLHLQYGNTPSRLDGVQGTVVVLKPLRQSKAVSSPGLKPGGMCPVRQLRRAESFEPSTLETRRWRQLRAAVLVQLSCDRTVRGRHEIGVTQHVSSVLGRNGRGAANAAP